MTGQQMMRVIGRLILIITLLALYLQIDIILPFMPFFISCVILRLFVPGPTPAFRVLLWFFLPMTLYLSLISIRNPIEFAEQFRSWILLLLALMTGIFLAERLKTLGHRRVAQWFWWIALVLTFGALLERIGPLRPLSDAIRESIYSFGVYDNDIRDLRDYGFVRPKLFTSEPSHLGKFIYISLIISALGSVRLWSHILLGVLGYLVVGSPAALLAVPTLIAFIILRKLAQRRNIVISIAAFSACGVIVLISAYFIAYSRLGFDGGGIEPSAFIRIVRPIIVAKMAIAERPFLGFGLGAEQELRELYITATFMFREQSFVQSTVFSSQSVWGNVHFGAATQFGVAGMALWWILLDRIRAIFDAPRAIFWTFYIVYGVTQGSLNSPLFLAPLLMVAGAGKFTLETRRVVPMS